MPPDSGGDSADTPHERRACDAVGRLTLFRTGINRAGPRRPKLRRSIHFELPVLGGNRLPFGYRDRLTGKWVKARYVAERKEIGARY